MARARNIKPGFFKNENLAECSAWARLCFAGLWILADRAGRLEDRPKRIKGELFPFDSIEVEPLLQELEANKFIERYETDGMKAIQVLEFVRHQTPHYSEKQSVIKPRVFQEKSADDQASIPGELLDYSKKTPRKEASSRGGRNPLNPDSLIPDSPNPDSPKNSSEPGGSDAAGPKAETPATPLTAKDRVWLLGVALLGDKSRGLLGKLSKSYGDEALADVLAEATIEKPVEPKAWVTAACEARARSKPRQNGQHSGPDLLDDPRPDWAISAGFTDRFQAENAGCGPGNSKLFRDGKRLS